MRRMLFILCFVAILSAMSIELEEKGLGLIEYRIEERNASNSSLTIVLMKGNIQRSVSEVDGFNGLYSGTFQVIEPATYTVKAFNMDTGNSAESSITLSAQEAEMEVGQLIEEAKEEQIEQQTVIGLPEEQASWLLYLIVGVFILIVIVFLFGNPLKKPKKKK